jgi:hypothetical protein
LAVWIAALAVPAFVAGGGSASPLQLLGIAPAIYILAAYGFLLIIRILFPHQHHRAEIWPFGLGAALITLLVIASLQFTLLFYVWPDTQAARETFDRRVLIEASQPSPF